MPLKSSTHLNSQIPKGTVLRLQDTSLRHRMKWNAPSQEWWDQHSCKMADPYSTHRRWSRVVSCFRGSSTPKQLWEWLVSITKKWTRFNKSHSKTSPTHKRFMSRSSSGPAQAWRSSKFRKNESTLVGPSNPTRMINTRHTKTETYLSSLVCSWESRSTLSHRCRRSSPALAHSWNGRVLITNQ